MFNKLKQFKDLRDKAKSLQDALAQETAEGTSGWGKVRVKINGNQEILEVNIEPDVLTDKARVEGLVKEAVNDAIQKIQKVMSTKLRDIGGMDLASEFQEAFKQ